MGNSRFTLEQNCNFTELGQITRKAVFFAVFVENGEGSMVSLFVRPRGVNLDFFLDYGEMSKAPYLFSADLPTPKKSEKYILILC